MAGRQAKNVAFDLGLPLKRKGGQGFSIACLQLGIPLY